MAKKKKQKNSVCQKKKMTQKKWKKIILTIQISQFSKNNINNLTYKHTT